MKKIAGKLICLIVPVVIISLLVVANVAVRISKSQLEVKMQESTQSAINEVENNIRFLLSEPEIQTASLAKAIGSDLQVGDDLYAYEKAINNVIENSDYIIAMGIFMDPVAWGGYSDSAQTEEASAVEEVAAEEAPAEEVVAEDASTEEAVTEEAATENIEETAEEATVEETTPEEATEEATVEETAQASEHPMINYYWVKDGGKSVFTDIGQDLDLRGTEWWIALEGGADHFYTETYVDDTIGTLMCSYVVPITDKNGNFIGCFNTDISMAVVEEMINSYTIGQTGRCQLFQTSGMHLTGVDADKILNEEFTILNDTDKGLDTVGQEILDSERYEGKIKGTTGSFFCHTIKFDTYDWILVTLVNQNETAAVIKSLKMTVVLISIIATIICLIVIALLAQNISKPIIKVQSMADLMSEGDFSMDPLPIKGQDEVSKMTEALNKMLEANRKEMMDISGNSQVVSDNSETLQNAVRDLQGSFADISAAISAISNAMMDNNATTEELSASVAEVKESVNDLALKATESEKMSLEIMNRAKKINHESTSSFDNAMALTKQYEEELNGSIENSKVVEEIGIMADAINDIASQINLLSLNASIEAARAGEAGRGFAVVATEIGNLASQTSATVSNIQETIVKVKEAVTTLADNSGKIITFINESVTPDYKNFVDVSVQYEADAVGIKELSEYVSKIAGTLSTTMEEFTIAIQTIAEMSQDTTESAATVLSSVDVVSENVENVDNISNEQLKISKELDDVVARYKL